jgi:hypothetical protein
MPGTTDRGAVGQHAVSHKPLLGTSAGSNFHRCLSLHVTTPFTMPPKLCTAEPPANNHDDLEEQTPHQSTRDISSPPPNATALVMEQMALINVRVDAQAI